MVKSAFKKKGSFKGEENPFNLKLNREKHTVLGKTVKGTKGLRSISRANSHLKKKELYNKTKEAFQKANTFIDRRLLTESVEDDAAARFVKERKKKFKKNIFDLNDEDLTHNGVPLNASKTSYQNQPGSDDEEQLDAAFVDQVHFGGFATNSNQKPLSHKEVIDQLILESKQKKHEKKIENELTVDMTEKLNSDWKNFHNLFTVGGSKKPGLVVSKQKPATFNNETYNTTATELKYVKRGTPATRAKTLEELEKEEQEKLQKLETERRQRMNDDKEIKSSKDHLSADSILDDFDVQPIVEDDTGEHFVSPKDPDYSDTDESDIDELPDDMSEAEGDAESMQIQGEDSEEDVIDLTLNIPLNIDEFEEFIETHGYSSAQEILLAIEGILKPHLKAKSEKKLNRLAKFFGILIEYALKCVKSNPAVSKNLAPYLYDVAEITPLKSSEKFISLLDEEQELFQKCKARKKKSTSPRLETLQLFKYCSVLFSVSDFTHPVITPAILFMCDVLSSEFFMTFQSIEYRLFICSIIFDCVSCSKRLVPEALNFLNKILNLATSHKNGVTRKAAKHDQMTLVIDENQTCDIDIDINIFNPKSTIPEDSRKLCIILKSVNLLQKFVDIYKHLSSFHDLFSETLCVCTKLPTEYYPVVVTDSINKLVQGLKERNVKLTPLTYENTKPKPLKLFEPSFESKFSKKDNINRKYRLLKNVAQKIRKEEKDHVREMRRDMQVVASEKLKEQLESDAERKRKVKELYHDLATQEGEYKKSMKKKV